MRLIVLWAATLVSCAAGGSYSGTERLAVFEGLGGKVVWDQQQREITFEDEVLALEDCSDTASYCLFGDGFELVIPKVCSDLSKGIWRAGRFESRLVGVQIESSSILVASDKAPNYAFLVGKSGITAVYIDKQKRNLFAEAANRNNVNFRQLREIIFYKKTAFQILPCS